MAMFPLGNEIGRQKYYVKGQKFYSSVILFRRGGRILRKKSFDTACDAIAYGHRVIERYHHWCDIALAKEMTK
jgi:hypothetical protein